MDLLIIRKILYKNMHNFRARKALGRIIVIFGNKHIDTPKKNVTLQFCHRLRGNRESYI